MRRRWWLGLAAAGAVLPATASASPTLQTDRPCYTPGEPIGLTGAGYTPGGQVDLIFGLPGGTFKLADPPARADAAGGVSAQVEAPDLASRYDTSEDVTAVSYDETLIDQGAEPSQAAGTADFMLSIFDVFVDPWDHGRVDPRKRVKLFAYGYEPATKLWAHYVRNGRRVKTVFLGRLHGPCGDLTKRMREFPFRPVPAGTYSVYFQGSRRLDTSLGTPYRHVRVPRTKAVP